MTGRTTAAGLAPESVIRRHFDKVERAAEDAGLPAGAMRVLRRIRRIAIGGCSFRVNPSRAYLAAKCQVTERQVSRDVGTLEAGGWLEVDRDEAVHHRGRGWHRRKCNRYRLVIPPGLRKARSAAGDISVTCSNQGSTDRTPSVPCTPVDNWRCTPPDPPWPGPTPGGLAEIARIKAQRGIA